jgi:hypothetical protein
MYEPFVNNVPFSMAQARDLTSDWHGATNGR